MLKLLRGLADYRRRVRPEMKPVFEKLALGQKPDVMLIACSDSRVAPNVFASTDPGDVFVMRNVGNIVPPAGAGGRSMSDESEAAAVEFALLALGVRHVVVCGHSSCGAMAQLVAGRQQSPSPHLASWLRHAEPALGAGDADAVSRASVLLQIEHLRTYPVISAAEKAGKIRMHAWWFDIHEAEVQAWFPEEKAFRVLDDERIAKLAEGLDR